MYKCRECGLWFKKPITCQEPAGEYQGRSANRTYNGCPHCRSEYYEQFGNEESRKWLNEAEYYREIYESED